MNYLISYDIGNNRLRLKAAKLLIGAGLYRIQRSVFLGKMKPATRAKLLRELHAFVHARGWSATDDSLLVLPLHQYSQDHQLVIGHDAHDWDLIYQKLHTLVL